jgi:hypothetical protein
MEHMWHAAILDTQFYSSLQWQLGMELHHRPQGALEAEEEQMEWRCRDMVTLYKLRYGSEPLGWEESRPLAGFSFCLAPVFLSPPQPFPFFSLPSSFPC